MRQVLVVSPNFPPVDSVDMHRLRMTVGHYAENGWRPVILTVAPEDTGRRRDEGLMSTLPAGLEVIQVSAPASPLAAALGLNATGLRAWRALERAGRRLLAGRRFDLVFITTTEFPVMALGRAWKQRFGTPFVLDFQDPWATFPATAAPYLRGGLKHRLMRLIHQRLEAWTLPAADGLMAVSQSYIDLLAGAYPGVRDIPSLVSPFPFSARDFVAARERGVAHAALARGEGRLSCLYAGRVAPAMEPSLTACFDIVARGRRRRPELFDRLRFVFVGTGYAPQGNPSVALRLASAAGMADRVIEHPDRIAFLDAQKSMLEADILLVLGSNDDGYIPSKLNQSLSLARPVICAAPAGAQVSRAVAGLASVLTIITDRSEPDEALDVMAARLERLLGAGEEAFSDRDERVRPFEAGQAARRDCDLFDRAAARRPPAREIGLDAG